MATADTMEKYTYTAPKPQTYDALQKIANNGDTPINLGAANDYWKQQGKTLPEGGDWTTVAQYYETAMQNEQNNNDMFAGLLNLFKNRGTQSGGDGVANRDAIINALRQRMKTDPYASLRAALQRNAAGAQKTGASAIDALRQQIGQMQNPYANVKFNTPMPSANPLAAYMQQSGASGDQVNALSNWLGSLSANATAADQEMANRLSLSTQNDIQQRLADAGFSEASFKQALADNLASQQAALDLQKSQYQNDILMQLAQLGATA